jgi:hypothetical protein
MNTSTMNYLEEEEQEKSSGKRTWMVVIAVIVIAFGINIWVTMSDIRAENVSLKASMHNMVAEQVNDKLALRRSEDQVVALEKKLITQASETRTALLALADTETQLGEVNRNIANLTAKLQSANKTKEVLSLELSAQRKKMAQLQAPKEEQSLWQRLKWW